MTIIGIVFLILKLAQELEAAGSKVLVYLPDGGDCASKEECAARFHIFIPFFLVISPHSFFQETVPTKSETESSIHLPIYLLIIFHALHFIATMHFVWIFNPLSLFALHTFVFSPTLE